MQALPLLFNLFLEIMMAMALEDVETGALINGSIINNLRFADDIAATAESQDDLQMIVDNIVEASKSMGMRGITDCIDDVSDCMRSNRLQLNSAKTETSVSTLGLYRR